MKAIIPSIEGHIWKSYVTQMKGLRPLKPFSQIIVQFVQELSRRILHDPGMKPFPEMIALGYWTRKAHLHQLQEDFERFSADKVIKSRGVVLHFAPSNVDTIFIYSWVLSLLAGNANVIRISRQENEQVSRLLKLLSDILELDLFQDIKRRIFICTYDHDDEITTFLSAHCHCRVIWGGDETVQRIRAIPLAPLATELVFPDRFSSAVLSAQAVLDINDVELMRLAQSFYSDAFWFDQMACSSSRFVVWVGGEPKIVQAKERFWSAIQAELDRRGHHIPPAAKMLKLTTAYYLTAQEPVKKVTAPMYSEIVRMEGTKATDSIREIHCGAGLFIEFHIEWLEQLADIIQDKDQTLTHFGFSREQLIQLVERIDGRGIDRIVPVGQALDFNEVWDGYRLLMYFTREVDIRV